MMKPILLEIVSKVLTTYDYCHRCKILLNQVGLGQKFLQKESNEYPSDSKEEYMRLSDWIRELRHLYKHRLLIRLIDVQSPLGIYKSLRHWIRTYPTFIIEGKETYAGWDKKKLEDLLDKYIHIYLNSRQQSFQSSLP